MATYRNKLFAAASVVVAAGTVAVSGLAPASACLLYTSRCV